MNYVLRVTHADGSLILKQSRDFVQKYPQVAAPIERTQVETRFYQMVAHVDTLSNMGPKVIGYDDDNHVICMTDLGHMDDCMGLYGGAKLTTVDIDLLLSYLSELHALDSLPKDDVLYNHSMRALNAEHIFDYPFMAENGLDYESITPGLSDLAKKVRSDDRLLSNVKTAKEMYLNDGQYLLHGDYYPGSWLKAMGDIKIIDPEFCFYGPREFDYAIFYAHLLMSNQDISVIEYFLQNLPQEIKKTTFREFAGIEILRRILGLAQLPLEADLEQKSQLITVATSLIKE